MSCLGIPTINAFKIVETDASEIGYGGILKQLVSPDTSEKIVHFLSEVWNTAKIYYSTIKKKIICSPRHLQISKWFTKSKVFVMHWFQKW